MNQLLRWARVLVGLAFLGAGLGVTRVGAAGRAAPAIPPPIFNVNAITDVAADFTDDPDFTICRTHTHPNNTTCTLRAAIQNASRFVGGGATIILPAGTYALTLAGPGSPPDSAGGLALAKDMSIVGAGAASTIVDGGGLGSVFTIQDTSIGGFFPTVSISGVTIRNGSSTTGGGIENGGYLTVSDSSISGNIATSVGYGGGGIRSDVSLTLTRSTVSDNRALANDGGGISITGIAVISNSTVRDNQAKSGGGIFLVAASATVDNSLIRNNFGQYYGGGVFVTGDGFLTVTNSTISNNSLSIGYGGGVYANGAAAFYQSTIAGNLTDRDGTGYGYGGGIYTQNTPGPLKLYNTLLAENYVSSTASDCAAGGGTVVSGDYNYIQTTAGCPLSGPTANNITGLDPLIGPLQNNGGATFTRGLLAGSPSIDQIPPGLCADQFGTAPIPDQRGVIRPVGPLCDIGAFEGALPVPFFGRNLIRNGDAESAAGSPNGTFVGTPRWSVTQGMFTAVPYNSPNGFPAVPTDTVPANHGYNFFAGGLADISEASQTLDLNPVGGAIDTGQVSYELSADLGGYAGQGDNATLALRFYDGTFTLFGSPVTIGPVTVTDRQGLTGLLHVSVPGQVPVGTRFLQAVVTMNGSSGFNDGYADNISVVLNAPPLFLPLILR